MQPPTVPVGPRPPANACFPSLLGVLHGPQALLVEDPHHQLRTYIKLRRQDLPCSLLSNTHIPNVLYSPVCFPSTISSTSGPSRPMPSSIFVDWQSTSSY